jgi:hypothetical protein
MALSMPLSKMGLLGPPKNDEWQLYKHNQVSSTYALKELEGLFPPLALYVCIDYNATMH